MAQPFSGDRLLGLNPGDIIVDGGNSNYKHSVKIGAMLKEHNIGFMDCGTSGGVWGLENGYCLMVGADNDVAKAVEPVLRALAPTQQDGWLHVGPIGSGHYTKMIHNGIEYGMMESFAEGLELLKGKTEFDIDLAKVTELWRHGSVVRSWLLSLARSKRNPADQIKRTNTHQHLVLVELPLLTAHVVPEKAT